MWASADGAPDNLPEAFAMGRLVGGAFLEEIMSLESGSSQGDFTRVSYFNYNAMDQQYEYFSLDTRQPQMMNERSIGAVHHDASAMPTIELFGESFVASQWGSATDAPFKYRLTAGPVQENRQEVLLYLTPRKSGMPKEFIAFR
jgi:hypothetical protein